jgi:hypothetical protein
VLSGRLWLRAMRRALISVGLVILGLGGYAASESLRWRREANAQCQAAKPLVESRAGINELSRLGRNPGVSSYEEAPTLVRMFGASSEEAESIGRNLRPGQRVVVYSESNSVMLVFLDSEGRAFRAECFLQ